MRRHWNNPGLGCAILPELGRRPLAVNREKFLAGMESGQCPIADACVSALARLARDPAPEHLIPLLQLLRRAAADRSQERLRAEVLALIARQSGQSFGARATGSKDAGLKEAPVFAWFAQQYPAL